MRFFQWLRSGEDSRLSRRGALPNGVRPVRLEVETLEERAAVSTIYGITPGNVLIRFDSASPDQVTMVGTVNVGTGETIRGIDFRPRTGQLFAVSAQTALTTGSTLQTYVIDPLTAQATLAGSTAAVLAAGNVPTGFDFNPTVDRIRYVNTNDQNARLNPNNGARADTPANDTNLTPAATSDIIAEAYDRNFDRQLASPAQSGFIQTTLYGINRNDSTLVTQGGVNQSPSPNGGAIMTVGSLGFTLSATNDGGFDIVPGSGSQLGQAFAALTASDGMTRLYSINLGTGAATNLGLIANGGTEVYSIAVTPDSTVTIGSFPGPQATVFNINGETGQTRFGQLPYDGYPGGVSVATGDVTGDGVPDLISGAGPGAPGGHVRVFDGNNGQPVPGLVGSFFAFPGFTGGISVASGDVNADGFDDIVVGAGAGGPGGHVKVFDGQTGTLLQSFFAFDTSFLGGITVGAADFDLDGRAEVIVGAGPGALGGHVKVFGQTNGQLFSSSSLPSFVPSFFAYPGFSGGINVAGGDVNFDGRPDIITGAGAGGPGGHVKAFSGQNSAQFASFFAYGTDFSGGVQVGVADVNQDGRYEIRTSPGPGIPGDVRAFDALTAQQLNVFIAFGGFPGGTFVSGSRFF
jgi:Domain of unknown function (DUF4394)/FG-GAP-like repeat/FG-GAP repeat